MNFNSTTQNVSFAVLVIACLYALAYTGITGLLFTAAIAMIAHSFLDCFEMVTAITVLFVLFYTFFLKKYLGISEPFQDGTKTIVDRIQAIQKKVEPKEPSGVYASSIEGFADVQSADDKDGAASTSTSAPAKTADQVDSAQVNSVTKAIQDKDIEKKELQSATGTLFKEGQMPSEHESGPKLDAGKTIMKAMESFDSDTVSNMTSDTKNLLQTQKKLMDMLTQMRPVLADGKELLQTFSGMFGGTASNNGGGSGMPFALKM